MLLEAGAVVAVAVAVLVAVTTLALRRSEANRRSRALAPGGRGIGVDGGTGAGVGTRVGRNLSGGMLASLPTWGGVLITVVLLLRGKVALALVAAVATIVHSGLLRWRATRS